MNPSAPKSVAAYARTFLLDAGPLIAALNAADPHHVWAKRIMMETPGRFVTCEACLAEILHGVENAPRAITALRGLLSRMEIVPVAATDATGVFDLLSRFAPAMDLADSCLVILQRRTPVSIIITTDDRDFATYRAPYISPKGLFAVWA